MSRILTLHAIGRMDYETAHAFQRRCVAALRESGEDAGTLILLEHPPVLTIGRGGTAANILAGPEVLAAQGVAVHETNRGGDVTYHGPGQVVGYPILPLRHHGKDVHRFLRTLEQIVIGTLADYDIPAERKEGLTGVWTAKGKICSIGVAVRHWISYHGFALNRAPNMDHFRLINPCGLVGVRMTSMEEVLGAAPPREEVERRLLGHFVHAFDFTEVRHLALPDLEPLSHDV